MLLPNDLALSQAKWVQYRELLDVTERIDLLNDAAEFFFRLLQDALWEDIWVARTRLTDPATIRDKQNLSIRRIPTTIMSFGRNR